MDTNGGNALAQLAIGRTADIAKEYGDVFDLTDWRAILEDAPLEKVEPLCALAVLLVLNWAAEFRRRIHEALEE